MNDTRAIYVLGAGGHGRVVIDALRCAGKPVAGVLDPNLSPGSELDGLKVLGGDELLSELDAANTSLANGVGIHSGVKARTRLFEDGGQRGFRFPPIIHPAAIIARDCVLLEGCQIMAGAVLQCHSRIGANTVINTRASVDHDCLIGDHAFISPGAILCGGVRIGARALVGAGAVILPGVAVGADARIGAGAVILKDVPEGMTAVGNPGRKQGWSCRE
jgi:sugar O-acyltransferase (sialic acid O-acetyltransferase NeuD family)